jgi:hypothetical protein
LFLSRLGISAKKMFYPYHRRRQTLIVILTVGCGMYLCTDCFHDLMIPSHCLLLYFLYLFGVRGIFTVLDTSNGTLFGRRTKPEERCCVAPFICRLAMWQRTICRIWIRDEDLPISGIVEYTLVRKMRRWTLFSIKIIFELLMGL